MKSNFCKKDRKNVTAISFSTILEKDSRDIIIVKNVLIFPLFPFGRDCITELN